MFRSRARRRLASIAAIAVLALTQALVAAHACVVAAPADEAVESCHQGAPEQPSPDALCKAHCEAGTQTVDQARPLAAPDLGAPLVMRRVDDVARFSSGPATRQADWLTHAATPPSILLHRRLLI